MTTPTAGEDPCLLAAWVQLRISEMMRARILKNADTGLSNGWPLMDLHLEDASGGLTSAGFIAKAYYASAKTVQDAADARLESASLDQDALQDSGRSTGRAWLAAADELRDGLNATRGTREIADFDDSAITFRESAQPY